MKVKGKFGLWLIAGIFWVAFLTGCLGGGLLQYGSLRGRVLSASGESLGGVLVEVGNRSTLTLADGSFLIDHIPTGKRYVFFSHSDYAGKVLEVEITADVVCDVNPEGVVYLAEKTPQNQRDFIFEIYQLGFYEKVVDEANTFLALYPQDPLQGDVIFARGASFYYLEEYAKSIADLDAVTSNYPGSEFADDAQYLLAKSYGEGYGDYYRAISEYRRLIEQYPQSDLVGAAHYEIGDCYYILGDYFNAYQSYQQAQGFGGELERKSIYAMGHCMYKLNNFLEAARYFDEYVNRYPNTDLSGDAQYFEGASLYRAERFSEALLAFEDCVEKYPQETWYNGIAIAPAALFHKGLCLERLQRYAEAYETYLYIIKNYPGAKWADGSSLIKSVRFRIDWLNQNIF